MKEIIIKIIKSKVKNKKYTAIIRNKETKKERRINFGDNRYKQFKDSTPLQAYASKNHGDKKRRQNYFLRHSGVKNKFLAVALEKKSGLYTPKLLAHIYLW